LLCSSETNIILATFQQPILQKLIIYICETGFDKQTLKLIDEIEELEPSIKDKLLFLANAIIRNAKTGKAYS